MASLYVFHREHERSVRGVLRDECLGRIASAIRLAQVTPPDQRAATLAAVSTPLTHYWLTSGPPGSSAAWQDTAREQLLRDTLSADHGQPVPSLFRLDPMLDRRSSAGAGRVELPPPPPPSVSSRRQSSRFCRYRGWPGRAAG
ncbi:MAG: hypothetical protein LBK99_18775 [Opitutaceae bacterium]|jgi:hypothetical protein|nr:hypothetical protein [Opitutaceae bacterium]